MKETARGIGLGRMIKEKDFPDGARLSFKTRICRMHPRKHCIFQRHQQSDPITAFKLTSTHPVDVHNFQYKVDK